MTVPAWRKHAPASSHFDIEDDDAQESPFYAGERICAPSPNTRGSSVLPACLVLLIAIGGWALGRHFDGWKHWLSTNMTTASALMDYRAPPPAAPQALPEQPPPVEPAPHAEKPPPQHASESVAASNAVPPEPLITASIETAPADKALSVAPLAPPKADLTDPHQRRASAVGLHPDLSRALLVRLSPADYRNAGVAIDTAVAETPDTGTFVWPRQRRPELALFQVRFVPGAAPDCRRYVVTVTKDRWSTTALPMERCGPKLAARKSAP
ncbi:MAG: hypothetical protein H7Y62_15095 [Hyphomicrobium sp.]|nr:hypothetical protein [Hyphomicrobium sp.]